MEIPSGLTTFVDHGLELVYSLGPSIEPTLVLGELSRGAKN